MPKIGVLPISLPHIVDLRVQRLGIAGAVREKHAVGLEREHVFGGSERRHDGHFAARVHQPAQNILFDAEIVGDHVEARLGGGASDRSEGEHGSTGLVHCKRSGVDTRLARSRPAMEGIERAFSTSLCGILFDGRQDAAHHAAAAQMAHQSARIEIGDDRDAGVRKEIAALPHPSASCW